MTSIVEVSDLKFSIGAQKILNGVNFSIARGETVGIIGPNGCGKTTLFNCLSGFTVGNGSIKFDGSEISADPAHQRALRGIGRVFQNFGIFREMTVLENVITAIESRQPAKRILLPWFSQHKKNREHALELLKRVNIESRAADKAGSLSGGQMRLLEIIRTLAFGAELFLLDEPTAGVSPRMKDDIAKLIISLQEMNKTVMVIEHDINFIQKFCHRVIVMDSGQVVLQGTPDEVRKDQRLQEIYFGKS